MAEAWLPIKGIRGYFISSFGRVKSIRRKNEIIRKTFISRGYEVITIVNAKKLLSRRVHRLVLEAFIPNKSSNLQAAHINGDSKDNRIENLMWATCKENQSHKSLHGTLARGNRNGKSKLTEEQVKEIMSLLSTASCSEISRMYGVSAPTIHDIKQKRSWSWMNTR